MFSNIYIDELKKGRQMYATKCIRELPTYQRNFGMELGIRSKIGKINSDRSYWLLLKMRVLINQELTKMIVLFLEELKVRTILGALVLCFKSLHIFRSLEKSWHSADIRELTNTIHTDTHTWCFFNWFLNSSSKSWSKYCSLRPRLWLSFLSWNILLLEKQYLARSKLKGATCNTARQFFVKACSFSWSDSKSLDTIFLQAAKSRISSPELLNFPHVLIWSTSSLSLWSQVWQGSRKGCLQFSHNGVSGELEVGFQPSSVFLNWMIGTDFFGDRGLEAKQVHWSE